MAKIKNDYTTVAADGTVLVHMAPKKKMKLSLTKRKALSGWLLVLPFVIGLIAIYGPILINSIRAVFSSVKIITGGVEYKHGILRYKSQHRIKSCDVELCCRFMSHSVFCS